MVSKKGSAKRKYSSTGESCAETVPANRKDRVGHRPLKQRSKGEPRSRRGEYEGGKTEEKLRRRGGGKKL